MRNVVVAAIVGSGSALLVGHFCLGPDRSDSEEVAEPSVTETLSTRRTGEPSPREPTTITGAEVQREGREQAREAPAGGGVDIRIGVPFTEGEPASSAEADAEAPPSPPRTAAPAPAPVPTPESTDAAVEPADAALEEGAAEPDAAPARTARATPLDAGVPEVAAPPAPTIGAGRFITEPAPWDSTTWKANPEAGAGTFITETPEQPIQGGQLLIPPEEQ